MSDSKRLIRGPKIYPVKITVRSSPPDPDKSQSVGEDYSSTSKPTPPHEVLSSSDFVEVGVTGPETISVDLVMDSGRSYNVVFVRYSGVGKTALISRIADLNPSLDRHFSTSGVEIKIHTVEKDHKTMKLCIRETACFGTSNSSCFRDADGFVVVYDATNQYSFNYVKEVLEQIGCHGSGNVKKVLVGNKSDLDEGKVVSFETAKAFADELGIPFMETSAKNSINVELCIMTMFSEMTYRDWANLPIDLLIKIFTASPLLPPDTRSSMVTVCSNWCKAIFSSPPWPELLFSLVYLGECFHYLIYDEQCDRFFEVVDPIRNLGPVKLSMRLIGGNGRKFLFVDSMRRCLVVWNLVSEPGMPYLYPQEVFLDLPSDSLSLENINLGSTVIVEESTLRVVLVSGNLLLASSFDKSGHQLVQWTEVADFSGSSSRRFELIVFCNGTAFLLDELARLCSVSWEGSGVVLREMPFVSSLHNPFMPELDRKISNFRTFILSLPATELNSPEKLVCLSYQIVKSSIFYGYFLPSEILEDAETGLMDFSELTDLGGCSILLSKSRAVPCVLQSPEVFGYKRNSVYHLSAEVDQVDDDKLVLKMRSFCLKEPFYKDAVIPFGAKWPYQFVVLLDPSQLPKSETNERGLHKAP